MQMKEGSGNGYARERSGNGPLFIGAPLGNLEGGSFTGYLQRL